MEAAADEPADLTPADGKLAVQSRLILPSFADEVSADDDAGRLTQEGEAEGEGRARVCGGSVSLDQGARDVRVLRFVLRERDVHCG